MIEEEEYIDIFFNKELPKYTICTYATHAQAMFKELEIEKYGIVLGGWGKKWNGYMDKPKFIINYIKTLDDPENHIIIFIDGFDTKINLNPEIAVKRFVEEFNCRFLISFGTLESNLHPWVKSKLFSSHNGICCNSGLYMGYANNVLDILSASLFTDHLNDDQRAIEILIQTRPDLAIIIDTQQRIFKNLSYLERLSWTKYDTIFLGYNAIITFTPYFFKKAYKYITILCS